MISSMKKYIASKESLSAEIHSSLNSVVKYATDNLIVTQPISIPYIRNMLDTNITVDDDAKLFETTRKNNLGFTSTCSQVMLKYDSLQFQHNNTTHMLDQKLPPHVREYLFFKWTVKISGQYSVSNRVHSLKWLI